MMPSVEREDAGRDLRAEEQLALVEPVGDHAAPRAEHEHRQELERGDDARARCRSCCVSWRISTRLREPLHPRAADRDRLADEVEAVVAVVQRAERVAAEAADAGHRGSSVSCSRSTAARASTARSSAVSVRSRCARYASRWRRTASIERAPVVGRRDPRDAAVFVALGAGREALGHEHVDDARDRRRLHPLGLGEAARA